MSKKSSLRTSRNQRSVRMMKACSSSFDERQHDTMRIHAGQYLPRLSPCHAIDWPIEKGTRAAKTNAMAIL
jgi:hypothetical protein